MRNLLQLSAVLISAVLYGACSSESITNGIRSDKGGSDNSDDDGEWVPVTVTVAESAGSHLALTGATSSYDAIIDNCVSGYSLAVGPTVKEVKVQNGDANCLWRMTSLTIGGEAVKFTGAEKWASGSSFVVLGAAGTPVQITVTSNLASPIKGAQAIVVFFGAAQTGTGQDAGASISAGISVTGSIPIALEVAGVDLTVNTATGAGIFNFTFLCQQQVVGAGSAAKCQDDVMATMRMSLKVDTTTAALTLDECRKFAMEDGTKGSVGTPFDAGSNAKFPNGGLLSAELTGPARLYDAANAKLILAIAGTTATSGCKYTKINIKRPGT